jgi:hypothetical protein
MCQLLLLSLPLLLLFFVSSPRGISQSNILERNLHEMALIPLISFVLAQRK